MPTSPLMMQPRMIQVFSLNRLLHRRQGNWHQRFVLLLLALVISACGDNKVVQCNQLIERVNQTELTLSSITQSSPPDINALKDIATATEQAFIELETVELSNRNLKTFRSRFSNFYGDISQHANTIVQAHADQNMKEAETAYNSLEETFQLQEPLVAEINAFCSEGYDG